MKKLGVLKTIKASILFVLGSMTVSSDIFAAVTEISWQGWFTMINRFGDPLINSSINQKIANRYITPVTGTLTYDSVQKNGSIAVTPFEFQSGSTPFVIAGHMELVGDGLGGPGNLMLGNFTYDWNGTTGVSFSIVWDASGMLEGLGNGDEVISGVGSIPSVDGSYAPFNGVPFISLEPAPLATSTLDTTNAPGCQYSNCMDVDPSGELPLIVDPLLNRNKTDYSQVDIFGIGGSPIQDDGFTGKNLNIDIMSMDVVSVQVDPDGDINGDGDVNVVDVFMATQIVLGLKSPTPDEILRGDVAPLTNGLPDPNGVIDAGDMGLIQRKVFGLVNF